MDFKDPQILIKTLLLFLLIGAGLDLVFLEHYEDSKQFIPLILISAYLITFIWNLLSSASLSKSMLSIMNYLMMISGLLGVYFHLAGNRDFVLERFGNELGPGKTWEILSGAFPIMAPLAMEGIGLAGILYLQLSKQ